MLFAGGTNGNPRQMGSFGRKEGPKAYFLPLPPRIGGMTPDLGRKRGPQEKASKKGQKRGDYGAFFYKKDGEIPSRNPIRRNRQKPDPGGSPITRVIAENQSKVSARIGFHKSIQIDPKKPR